MSHNFGLRIALGVLSGVILPVFKPDRAFTAGSDRAGFEDAALLLLSALRI